MSHKQRIIELREQIAQLENELEQEQQACMTEMQADGVLTDEHGEWQFQIQANPPGLDIDKKLLTAEKHPDLFKQAIDQGAVRSYLMENGNQLWGALKDDKPFKLVVKRIPLKAAA